MRSLGHGAWVLVFGMLSACASSVTPRERDGGRDDAAPTDASRDAPSDVADPVVSLAMNGRRVCVVYASGAAACWGDTFAFSGAAGFAERRTLRPVRAAGLTDAVQVALGPQHACVLRRGGGVACWGFNGNRELGEPAPGTDVANGVVQVAGVRDAVELVAGYSATCARTREGAVWCWGFNGNGELGDGTTTSRSAPRVVPGVTGAVALSAGASTTCARLRDGAVRCWGPLAVGDFSYDPARGAMPVPEFAGAAVVAVGQANNGCAARADGVFCAGVGFGVTRAEVLTDVRAPTSLAVGAAHACAVDGAGAVRCWGANDVGQLGDGTTASRPVARGSVAALGLTRATRVVASGDATCALQAGRVACWGAGWLGDGTPFDQPTPVPVTGLTDAVGVSAGRATTCAVRRGGRVVCWGEHGGRLGAAGLDGSPVPVEVPLPTTERWVQVCAGDSFSCVRGASGAVRCWGRGGLGDGSMHLEDTVPVPVAGLVDAVALGCRAQSACAVRSGGAVVCWGANASGQLGDGTEAPRAAPVEVVGLGPAQDVSVSGSHACALLRDRSVWCWGDNSGGELGDGTAARRAAPTRALTDAVAVSAGGGFTCAARATGLWCWGRNEFGQLAGVAATMQREPAVAFADASLRGVSAGQHHHACALERSGAVRCWGTSYYGELGSGLVNASERTPVALAGLDDAVEVSAGRDHACAVRSSGAVLCWGSNEQGQLGNAESGVTLVPTFAE